MAATAVAAALIAGSTGPATAQADRNSAPDGTGTGQEALRVTLITGDQVVLDAQGEPTGLIRAEGRASVPVRVLTSKDGEHTHVIPADVVPLLQEGTLDRRLFDVTELSRPQYRHAQGLPLIVGYEEDRPRALADTAAQGTFLDAIDADALTVAGEEIPALWSALTDPAEGDSTLAAAPGVATVALDGIVEKSLAESVPQIGAPTAWEAGYDGTGTTVAVLDTGISDEHPDLAGKIVAEQNFSESPDAEDRDGHGTHVASTATGTGAHSEGTYTGVAPGAQLINGKVLDDFGSGFESGIIEGMQWAVDQGADVVSMSLGGFATAQIDPMEEAVNTLSAESDALFVIAAGNSGPSAGSISTPGTADAALTLGAVDKSDMLADFSSVGPRARDGAVKPDVTAPGVDIAAAGAEGAAIWEYGRPVEGADGYVAIDGTSMATPHASGAAALLAQAHPDWTGEQIKAALTASARPGEGYTAFQQGAGRIDVPAALEQTVTAEPVSISFGAVPWPHEDAEPVTRDLTYANSGDEDVTLTLTSTGTDPEGNPAPEGMFALSADEVTVPAGSTATVQATADTTPGGELYGAYTSSVTATADNGQTVRTAGAVVREEQMFEVTVEAMDRAGAPAADWWGTVIDMETMDFYDVVGEPGTGTGTIRLPAGEYQLDVSVFHTPEGGEESTGIDWLVHPHLSLSEDTTVTADATQAALVDFTMPDESATQTDLTVGYRMGRGGETFFDSAWSVAGLPEGFGTAQIGEPGADRTISGYAGTTWETEGVEYHGADVREDAFYTGLEEHTEQSELASISVEEGASLEGVTGVLFTVSSEVSMASALEYTLPRTAEIFVEAGVGEWFQEFMQTDPEVFASAGAMTEPRVYEAGQEYQERFNVGVFGPDIRQDTGLTRMGNALYGTISPFTDGAGHLGYSAYDSASTTLYRDGEEIAAEEEILDYVEFELPEEEARYELVTTVGRDPAGEVPTASVSTEITTAFTFTSAAGPEDGPVPVPASVVRFAPQLALDSTATQSQMQWVPFTVQGAAAEGNVASLAISVSTDGGETWAEAAVDGDTVEVTNPAAGGTVSFRVELEDGQGNTTVQTIIDAYRTV
ncbi:S8 family peptidase [Streptomyces sp. SBT349]|uniref:S8 family peptidase n=1 Tax=Streptomyces sp. SBT349 TaxID=1580539 RepID=UPI00066EE76B|nr:S8 family serine peptidase [Streptomyces sp. SBT349]